MPVACRVSHVHRSIPSLKWEGRAPSRPHRVKRQVSHPRMSRAKLRRYKCRSCSQPALLSVLGVWEAWRRVPNTPSPKLPVAKANACSTATDATKRVPPNSGNEDVASPVLSVRERHAPVACRVSHIHRSSPSCKNGRVAPLPSSVALRRMDRDRNAFHA